jgi:ABC-type transport system substrate-binding protein
MIFGSAFLLLTLMLGAMATPGVLAQRSASRVVVASFFEGDTLDVHQLYHNGESPAMPLLYDKLVEFDQNMRVVPQLATSWSLSSDGLTWTFRLRQGHKFHDGTPVNAETVKQSFERLMTTGYWRTFFPMIDAEKFRAVDTYTFSITTKARYLFLLNRLTHPGASIVAPAAASRLGSAFGRTPIGSGPYYFREWIRGQRIVLQKNPAHWQAPAGNIEFIEIRAIPDDTARAVALETGEVDFVPVLPPNEAERLRRFPSLAAYNVRTNRIEGVYLNNAKKPFDDVRVRQAVAHSINREALVRTLWGARFAQVADSPLPPSIWGYKPQKPFEYNVARAKQLLTEAGHPNGFSASMWVVLSGTNEGQQGQAIGEMLRQVGITVKQEPLETGRYFDLIRRGPRESQLEMAFRQFNTWTAEPDYGLSILFHSSQFAPRGANRNFYTNPEVDDLLDRGPTILDDAERRRVYEKLQEILWRDQPFAFTAFPGQPAAGKKSIIDLLFLPAMGVNFRHAKIQ